MMTAMRLFTAGLLVVPLVAAEPAGFALWKFAELTRRDEALSRKHITYVLVKFPGR